MDIDEIIPQQHYLNLNKLNKVEIDFNKYESYGEILVMVYKNKFFSIDGHHRLYYIRKNNLCKKIKV